MILYNKTIIAIEKLNSFNAIIMDGFLTFIFLYTHHICNIENPIEIVYMHERVQIVLWKKIYFILFYN